MPTTRDGWTLPFMELLGKLAGIEISHRPCLNFPRVDLGIVDRLLAGLGDQMPAGFAFLFEVALKIGAAAAKNVNGLFHNNKIGNVPAETNQARTRF